MQVSPYVYAGLPKKFLNLQDPEARANQIIQIITKIWGVDFSYVQERRRWRDVVYKRQILMYLIRVHTNLGFKKIGEMFSSEQNKKYDHSTVMHSIERLTNLMWSEEAVRLEVESLKTIL